MSISKSLQSALNGKARSSGEFFKSESSAKSFASELKEAGEKNVRVSSYVDHKKSDGTKVYGWVVKCDA